MEICRVVNWILLFFFVTCQWHVDSRHFHLVNYLHPTYLGFFGYGLTIMVFLTRQNTWLLWRFCGGWGYVIRKHDCIITPSGPPSNLRKSGPQYAQMQSLLQTHCNFTLLKAAFCLNGYLKSWRKLRPIVEFQNPSCKLVLLWYRIAHPFSLAYVCCLVFNDILLKILIVNRWM